MAWRAAARRRSPMCVPCALGRAWRAQGGLTRNRWGRPSGDQLAAFDRDRHLPSACTVVRALRRHHADGASPLHPSAPSRGRAGRRMNRLTTPTTASSTMPAPSPAAGRPCWSLERDAGGHHARDAGDVAADDHHRAHLGDGAAEGGDQDGQHRPAVVQQHQQRAQAIGAHQNAAGRRRRAASHRPAGASARRSPAAPGWSARDHHRRGREGCPGTQRPAARAAGRRSTRPPPRQGQQRVEQPDQRAMAGKRATASRGASASRHRQRPGGRCR